MPFRFARNVRTLQRLRTIAQVLSRHGFGHLVENLDLGRFVPLWMKPKSRRDADAHETHTLANGWRRCVPNSAPPMSSSGK